MYLTPFLPNLNSSSVTFYHITLPSWDFWSFTIILPVTLYVFCILSLEQKPHVGRELFKSGSQFLQGPSTYQSLSQMFVDLINILAQKIRVGKRTRMSMAPRWMLMLWAQFSLHLRLESHSIPVFKPMGPTSHLFTCLHNNAPTLAKHPLCIQNCSRKRRYTKNKLCSPIPRNSQSS